MPVTEGELARQAEATGEELIARGERMIVLGRELLGMSAQLDQNAKAIISVEPQDAKLLKPADRSVGKYGAVTIATAINKATELGEFTAFELAEALGVDSAAGMKWAGQLMDREPPVVERDGRRFRCLLKPPLKIWVVRQAGSVFLPEEASEATGLEGDELWTELAKLEEEGVIERTEEDSDVLFEYVPPDDRGAPTKHPSRVPPERLPPSYDLAPRRGQPVRTKKHDRKGASTPGQRSKIVNNERNWEKLQAAQRERAEQQRAQQQARAQQGGKRKK